MENEFINIAVPVELIRKLIERLIKDNVLSLEVNKDLIDGKFKKMSMADLYEAVDRPKVFVGKVMDKPSQKPPVEEPKFEFDSGNLF
jgi:hypothetical protein